MKKFFINNGSLLTMGLGLIFFIMNDLTGDYLPKFSNTLITIITYFIIVLLPVSLSIYYKNKKWKRNLKKIRKSKYFKYIVAFGIIKKVILLVMFLVPLLSFSQVTFNDLMSIDSKDTFIALISIFNSLNYFAYL